MSAATEVWTQGDWVGWLWDKRRRMSERVCLGASLGECSNKLGNIAKERGIPDKHCCLTHGAPPDYKPISR
jgi:hypothetical protein